jgi:hypothetical protein
MNFDKQISQCYHNLIGDLMRVRVNTAGEFLFDGAEDFGRWPEYMIEDVIHNLSVSHDCAFYIHGELAFTLRFSKYGDRELYANYSKSKEQKYAPLVENNRFFQHAKVLCKKEFDFQQQQKIIYKLQSTKKAIVPMP